MMDVQEFNHPQLPGLVGVTWGGQCFTVFADRANAEAAVARDTHGLDLRIVARADGKHLIAAVDVEDDTFFYVDAGGIK